MRQRSGGILDVTNLRREDEAETTVQNQNFEKFTCHGLSITSHVLFSSAVSNSCFFSHTVPEPAETRAILSSMLF